MDWSSTLDFVAICARYIHVVAAIMWIGNSLLFTWMEVNFLKEGDDPSKLGYMNMLHAGGVYYLEKRVIDPVTLPPKIHRFLWQSYTTWISGFILFSSVFYSHGGTLLADPSKTEIGNLGAAAISFLSLVGGWVFYDLFWRTPIKNKPALGAVVCFAVLLGYAAWLNTVFNPRAVFLQVGAMMGTIMTANVFFIIIPNQRKMMAALLAGKPQDLALGKQAKVRSMMNNYITFPVIFLMLSAHFPQAYGADRNIAILAVMIVCLVIIKHLMNIYNEFKPWLACLLGTFVLGSAAVVALISVPPLGAAGVAAAEAAAKRQAEFPGAVAGQKVFNEKGCQACHLPAPSAIAPTLHGVYESTVELANGGSVVADEAYLRQSIMEPTAAIVKGYAPAMPAYGSMLTPEEVDHLVDYVKSLGSAGH